MGKKITLKPITRIEGHGKVTINLDDKGNVESSCFHVIELRGFEKFSEGRLVWEMPVITPRICGTCPVSHHLASAKAVDALLGVDIPLSAKMLRELMHMGQFIHNGSLHFFYFAAPDFILGPSASPEIRNIVGIVQKDPVLAGKAIELRKIGQDIVERVGGRPIHPIIAIPGGMSRALSHEDRYIMQKNLKRAIELSQEALEVGKKVIGEHADLIPGLGAAPSKHMGLVKDGNLELYDGDIRLIGEDGAKLEEFNGAEYLDYINEHVEDETYIKFPFYKKEGWPEGFYRVGPLARVNAADRISTPLAQQELEAFKEIGNGKPVQENIYYHLARLIETLYAVERAQELLQDDEIVNPVVRVKVHRLSELMNSMNTDDKISSEGVGVLEAPRGTLIHHYWSDKVGKLKKVNLVVATVHNNTAINRAVDEVARNYIKDGKVNEGILNHVEMAIRCYDPCLSCSSHMLNPKYIDLTVVMKNGKKVKPEA